MRLSNRYHAMWIVALWVAAVACPTSASLIGDDITLEVASSVATFFTGTATGDAAAVEFVDVSSAAPLSTNNVDILDDDTIEISFERGPLPGASFARRTFTFTDVDWGGLGTVVDLVNFNTVGTASFGSFDLLSPTSFRINNVSMGAGVSGTTDLATLTFDVVSAHTPGGAVPEPVSAALGLMSLGALSLVTQRRRAA